MMSNKQLIETNQEELQNMHNFLAASDRSGQMLHSAEAQIPSSSQLLAGVHCPDHHASFAGPAQGQAAFQTQAPPTPPPGLDFKLDTKVTKRRLGTSGASQSLLPPQPPVNGAPAAQLPSKSAALRKRTLVVAKFPKNMSEEVLGQAFGTIVGQHNVLNCRICRDDAAAKCYAFLIFANEAAANKAQTVCSAGDLILVDEHGKRWIVAASRSQRSTGGPALRQASDGSSPSCSLRMIL